MEDPEAVPGAPAGDPAADLATRVTDYLAGMTDRFCLRTYEELAGS
jgi:dGTP triphosphohydrolase